MAHVPDALRASLESAAEAVSVDRLAESVRRLIERYRSGREATSPILVSDVDATAYASYRMPATFAAVRSALGHVARVAPDFRPGTHVDVGGGTGAAAWAATDTFACLTAVTVLDQVDAALALGRRLAGTAPHPALRQAAWRPWRFDPAGTLPRADLVTISYVLGELAPPAREALLAQAVAAGGLVVVVEPGTPAGYERVLAARTAFLAAGLAVPAPCPHAHRCPLTGHDWCHFAARVNRSSLHRKLKDGQLGHEDEKFSYVAAGNTGHDTVGGRVLRHPSFRKGLVTLTVCAADGAATDVRVPKSEGPLYKLARRTGWGDPWPPT